MSKSATVVRFALLMCLALVSTPSCDTQGICNQDNCSGCCDSEGACQSGTTSLTCGLGGVACQLCSEPRVCSVGACLEVAPGADPGNIPPAGDIAIGGGSGEGGGSGGGTGEEFGGGVGGGFGGGVGGGFGGGVGGGFGGGLGGGFGGGGVGGGLGGGGTSVCNTTNCAGCCLGNTCINFPNNLSDVTCGAGGILCSDCTRASATCDPTTAFCRFVTQ